MTVLLKSCSKIVAPDPGVVLSKRLTFIIAGILTSSRSHYTKPCYVCSERGCILPVNAELFGVIKMWM